MNRLSWKQSARALIAGLMFAGLPANATHGPLLDDVEIVALEGRASARLSFTLPVRYVRHFPTAHGEILNVYLEASYVHGPEDPREEYRHAPHTAGLPEFSVTLSNRPGCHAGSNPVCLLIQFRKPQRFALSPGADGRSLLLEFPPDEKPAETSTSAPPAN